MRTIRADSNYAHPENQSRKVIVRSDEMYRDTERKRDRLNKSAQRIAIYCITEI